MDVMTPSMARAHAALDDMGIAPGPLPQRLSAEANAHAQLDELGIEAGPLPDRLAAAAALINGITASEEPAHP